MALQGHSGIPGLLVPSPQSEAVTHEMEELSLQPSSTLPPLNERKNVLQLRLQQRRTREQLIDQGIMPPLKSPAAFHRQIRSLERARTENFLKHKIRSRPERAELVRMHILQETQAEPSLQATQLKLKRARLANDLNEKLAQRPGPMELVEKNILPVDSCVKEAIIDGQMQYHKTLDVFEEDSGDALSPEQPASQDSQGSAASPGEPRPPDTPSTPQSTALQFCPPVTRAVADFLKPSTNEQPATAPAVTLQPVSVPPLSKPGPTLVKTQPRLPGDKIRGKKCKEPKPRVKKLKYHQYVPPDQKVDASEATMDSAYARLLQQQQLFLQLQILSQQQQQHYNYQTILPAPLKPAAAVTLNSASLPASIVVSLPAAAPLAARPPATPAAARTRKLGTLPSNLEEMKVAELKMELKLRGLPVSGTKTDLIERLKPYQETSTQTTTAMDVSNTPSPQPSMEACPTSGPASPIRLDLSAQDDLRPEGQDQERRLHEKERQIEELLRRLEQEQQLVEVLKMQLQVEKSNSVVPPPAPASASPVKAESRSPSQGPPLLKVEEVQPAAAMPQFIISHQGVPRTLLLPVSLPAVSLQPLLQTTSGLLQAPMMENPTTQLLQSPADSGFQCHTAEARETPQRFISSSTNNSLSSQIVSSNGPLIRSLTPPTFVLQSPALNSSTPKGREPPRYEDAIKQSRSLQNPPVNMTSSPPSCHQVPTATSQQMDDLFDILIESGEMLPFGPHDPPSLAKVQPVTATLSTLPINSALSRPPLPVQLAPPAVHAATPTLSLEALLESALDTEESDPHHTSLCLLDELQHPQPPLSPMDTSDLGFSEVSASSSTFSLQDTAMDSMEWLDLTMPVPASSLTALGLNSDFLDTQDLQLHWD
ncbi:myocardin-related transcription factor B isoform X2 [Denticeps clupeoides]|uniref:myocardin-related transcription factor B isoform X2 n=1 Tax=Denticeps clupeoides TaxID=299321 RepID=UPI0010A417E7|nr:myocardin-related transcription factor B isoform X2 [Denticeps clupeoides]